MKKTHHKYKKSLSDHHALLKLKNDCCSRSKQRSSAITSAAAAVKAMESLVCLFYVAWLDPNTQAYASNSLLLHCYSLVHSLTAMLGFDWQQWKVKI